MNTKNEAFAREQEEKRLEMRERLKPTPVDRHKMPRWLISVLAAARKAGKVDFELRLGWWYKLEDVFSLVAGQRGTLLDHGGRTIYKGLECFVSEPYGPPGYFDGKAAKLAEILGVRVETSTNSWWYPGATQRIILFPPEGKGRTCENPKWFSVLSKAAEKWPTSR